MAIIRPSAELRNRYKEISELCKNTNEPIYLTVNGKEDTVLLSSQALNELYETINLLTKLNRALQDVNEGRLTPLFEIKKKYGL
ncbi:MAG: type II toxin-antitoxin system Phd/YefM family antitoxin [Bacilli bacterium]|nr:type II toxin-antitoxin system Phd/YefM family antitoxin [Bacilli bacterium]